MNEFQEWCKEILPIVQAGADGEEIEVKDSKLDNWQKNNFGFPLYGVSFRIKPKTIRIGEFDVPEPERKPLNTDDVYYIAATCDSRMVFSGVWADDSFDRIRLKRGLIHLTEEAAIIHAKALISLTEVKDETI